MGIDNSSVTTSMLRPCKRRVLCIRMEFMVSLAMTLTSIAAHADSLSKVVHVECNAQSGRVYAKLYSSDEGVILPKNDHWFLDLSKNPNGLKCHLSTSHAVSFYALTNVEHPANDNLQIIIDGRQRASLSVDRPSTEPMDTYSEAITIQLRPDHGLTITKITIRDIE